MEERELIKQGFLGTAAPLYADVILLLEIGMACALSLGAILARLHKYKTHGVCQSIVVLMNAAVILAGMAPTFQSRVLPKLPARLGNSYYLLATAHALLGTIAEGAALYVLLAAGTRVLPDRFRFGNYRVWMRTTLVLWWCALLLGVGTYIRSYVH